MKSLQTKLSTSDAVSAPAIVSPALGQRSPSLRFRLRTSGVEAAVRLTACLLVIAAALGVASATPVVPAARPASRVRR